MQVERDRNKLLVTLPMALRVDAVYTRTEEAGDGTGLEQMTKATIAPNIAKAWVPLVYYRQAYGPWSHGDMSGRTQIVIDNTLAPWTAGGSEAAMNRFASARLKSLVDRTDKIGSGMLEVAGLPKLNLGRI